MLFILITIVDKTIFKLISVMESYVIADTTYYLTSKILKSDYYS